MEPVGEDREGKVMGPGKGGVGFGVRCTPVCIPGYVTCFYGWFLFSIVFGFGVTRGNAGGVN